MVEYPCLCLLVKFRPLGFAFLAPSFLAVHFPYLIEGIVLSVGSDYRIVRHWNVVGFCELVASNESLVYADIGVMLLIPRSHLSYFKWYHTEKF